MELGKEPLEELSEKHLIGPSIGKYLRGAALLQLCGELHKAFPDEASQISPRWRFVPQMNHTQALPNPNLLIFIY